MFNFFTKKKITKTDYSNYKILLNVKSICLFEKMANKSFLLCSTQEDVLLIMYCSLVCNNNLPISFELFIRMLEDKRFCSWIMNEYDNISRYNIQFANNEENTEYSGDTEVVKIGELASILIINYNMDPTYVMEKMNIEELQLFIKAAEEKKREELVEKRLFSFLQIAPLIDGKKIKKPEDILPYPWEKDDKQKKLEENLNNNTESSKTVLGFNLLNKDGE